MKKNIMRIKDNIIIIFILLILFVYIFSMNIVEEKIITKKYLIYLKKRVIYLNPLKTTELMKNGALSLLLMIFMKKKKKSSAKIMKMNNLI